MMERCGNNCYEAVKIMALQKLQNAFFESKEAK